MRTSERRVAIVGAGLAGLTAGYRLHHAGWGVEVFEECDEVGGRVRTVYERGYIIDTGASGLGSTYRAYIELAAELGVAIKPTAPCVGIRRAGQTHYLDMNKPVRSGLRTPLLSLKSKLRVPRLAFDVVNAKMRGCLDYADMKKSAPIDTESVRAYATRALGSEIDSYLCEPIVRTMLIADSDKVSKVELFSGIANIFTAELMSTAGGQGAMADALAAPLKVHLGTAVSDVRRVGDRVQITTANGTTNYDACVVACTLPRAAAMCHDDQALLAGLNQKLTYTQCVSVAVATREVPDCPAFLVMLPSVEDPDVALMFVDHKKAPDRAPAGHGLVTCLWETDAARTVIDELDETIVERTLESLFKVFPELRGQVEFTHVTRWRSALPFTRIGAYKEIGQFIEAIDPASPVQYASDYMSAAGQNTAVICGQQAADNLIARFGK
ncbi:NAD(P)/FAD-dependent oxidoreductase [Mycolicibacterium sp. CBMA 234]|uniref:protoporphyrinogen/coproporphyrinogen oxidase n=1 Tax=Mycolicibacterium sp. CBMA 234 TaxID=1918495 RepID=UPI0012DDCF95|nr:NAD(P)/FAD-dependent oxidoreductase [Mycolicibacterium sp. CBMA 234]